MDRITTKKVINELKKMKKVLGRYYEINLMLLFGS